MKILFLTIARMNDISSRGIYHDLMRKFRDEGHEVFIVSPSERRYREKTQIIKRDGITILLVSILNIQKTNIFEKGISTILIEYQFLSAVRRYFKSISYDLVLYSTPPITFTRLIRYIKAKCNAKSYLLLKDIFPQNSVDLAMIKPGGILHRYFRKKEKSLYRVSDYIGCMSKANVDYIRQNNPELNPDHVELNPNSINPIISSISKEEKIMLRNEFNIPLNSTVFLYGGNLGKPQGVNFIIQFLDHIRLIDGVYFLIVGSGTEFFRIRNWFEKTKPKNSMIIPKLQKKDYDRLVQACDIGLIFLDKRFTVPNFPSRLLSYLENRMPVIAATDKNTDLGNIITDNSFGLSSFAGDLNSTYKNILILAHDKSLCDQMGENGYNYLINNYTVDHSYEIIMKHFSN